MTNRKWLKQEVPKWVAHHLISDDEAKSILDQYKSNGHHAFGEAFFLLAVIGLFGGIFFGFAGLWNQFTQDQRFLLAAACAVVSLVILLVVTVCDKKIPDPVEEEEPEERTEEPFSFGNLSDSTSGKTTLSALGTMRGALGKLATVPPKRRQTYHHSIPAYIRETAGGFHGLCFLGAVWMVIDSFKLSNDYFPFAAVSSLILLVLLYLSRSAAIGIFAIIAACLTFAAAPVRGWPEVWAWVILLALLPFLAMLVRDRRDKASVVFSWIWALAVFFLIFWSASNMLWQTIFFSLAASLTWMTGSIFRPYGFASTAFRFFGGAALCAVLLEGSFGRVWANPSGNIGLWIIFLIFLAVDGVLLVRMASKKEWLSLIAGFTPFTLLGALIVSVGEPTGALSASIVSAYAVILGAAIAFRGIRMDRAFQRWAGILLLIAVGVIRVVDSALSFPQRGAFFLLIGLAAAAVCGLLYMTGSIGHRKKNKKRGRRKNRKSSPPKGKGSAPPHSVTVRKDQPPVPTLPEMPPVPKFPPADDRKGGGSHE